MTLRRVGTVLLTVLALGACASAGDPNAPETCIRVDNTGGGDHSGRVFMVGATDEVKLTGERIRIGEVPMGRSVTHCMRRSSFLGFYRLIIEDGLVDRYDPAHNEVRPGTYASSLFQLSPGDSLVWEVRTNRIMMAAAMR